MSENNDLNQDQENLNQNISDANVTHIESKPVSPKKQNSFLKKALTLLCVFAISVGGGYVGASIKGVNGNKIVINQVESTNNATTTASTTSTGSIANVAATAKPSVVEITTEQVQSSSYIQQYVVSGAGSGVIISSDGYILTNNHVIENATQITVKTNDGEEYQGKVIGADSRTDVAVIKIDATGLTAATIGDSSNLVIGETVVAIGNPLGTLGGSVSSGIISALDRTVTVENMTLNVLQTDAAISPGNSGGGLFNENGELIGIVNAKSSSSDAEGIGFALPINQVMEVANDLMTSGYVTNRPALGVTIQTASYLNGSTALIVSDFASNSKAKDAGLEVGDIIVAADDTQITSFNDLSTMISNKNIGDTIKLTVIRDNQYLNIDVELVEMGQTTTNPTQEEIPSISSESSN